MTDKIKVAICDDDFEALDGIEGAAKSMFSRLDVFAETEIFKSAKKLDARMREVAFDLILLDIDMPELDGIRFGKMLRERKDSTEIIFISNREEKVFDSFSVHPFGFVRKSRFLKDLSSVLQAFLLEWKKKRSGEGKLVFEGKYGIVTFFASELMYVEGNAKNQLLHVEGKTDPFIVHSSLETLEKQLSESGFLRVHKGYIVNCRYISAIMKDFVELVNGEEIPLSRRKATEIREKYLIFSSSDSSVLV